MYEYFIVYGFTSEKIINANGNVVAQLSRKIVCNDDIRDIEENIRRKIEPEVGKIRGLCIINFILLSEPESIEEG